MDIGKQNLTLQYFEINLPQNRHLGNTSAGSASWFLFTWNDNFMKSLIPSPIFQHAKAPD